MAIFKNLVADPSATFPTSLNLSLINNGVSATSLGSNAKAVLFNAVTTTATYNNVQLLVDGVNTNLTVADEYDGETFALLLKNGESYVYTIDVSTTLQTASAYNSFNSVSPEHLRLWNLNG